MSQKIIRECFGNMRMDVKCFTPFQNKLMTATDENYLKIVGAVIKYWESIKGAFEHPEDSLQYGVEAGNLANTLEKM